MSYLKKYKWSLVPKELPNVKRKCPKCDEKTTYENCEKFRVNANKNNIDVWSIYKCEKCKSTWNMTIYERVNPKEITEKEYDEFLENDKNLVLRYAFSEEIYSKNNAKAEFCDIDYEIIKEKVSETESYRDETIIEIECKYICEIRIDKLLSENLNISRSKIKNMYKEGKIFTDDNKNILKSKIKNKVEIHIAEEL